MITQRTSRECADPVIGSTTKSTSTSKVENVLLPSGGLRELHLFCGAGGGVLGGILLGHTCVCAVEIEPYCQKVLLQRQRDGILPQFPIWDDVRTFDGKPWRGLVDVVCGGFPCGDISPARTNNDVNGKQRGLDGDASGLWSEMRRVINEVRPGRAFIENSPMLRTRGLVRVLKDLDSMGYDTARGVFGCRQFGADHVRERMFILASNSYATQRKRGGVSGRVHSEHSDIGRCYWWKDQPGLERVANGMAHQMDRLAAIGNGQIPCVASLAWQTLSAGV
ncbi:MAG TPA: DNA cytosine methyltransferase [Nitrospiraceae bacterium]|nr:DNA cytosine methyltransferase [Nitrospiraceae bacterium]